MFMFYLILLVIQNIIVIHREICLSFNIHPMVLKFAYKLLDTSQYPY